MPTYLMNDAEIEIPDDWVDQSVNLFSASPQPPAPLSLVITRDRLKAGQDLPEFAETKLGELESQLTSLKIVEKRQIEVGGQLALEAELRWTSKQGPVHQRQVYIENGERVLVLTATSPGTISAAHASQFEQVLSTLKLRH